ncbi:hypothetical protein [Rhizobium leguminosarum]|uniref:hypothetical protein n=1 Tax=Rhizobium leguminosarum TaxID=384 RepID=UPI00144111AE|nr:hypothetical protein [Rhizobium leguminosarum]NKK77695.1 hypothetical protein [Rhizobium leguminosarum bv. viciae]
MKRVLGVMLFTALATAQALAAEIQIGKQKVTIQGYAISKSTSGRLVNVLVDDPLADAQKTVKGVYIPAGTRLAVTDQSFKDRQNRSWSLVSTEDGILAYVRSSSPGKGAHFWSQDQIEQYLKDDTDSIAIIQTPVTIKSSLYGPVVLTTSEIYRIDAGATPLGDQVALVLDGSKMGDKWTANETVNVSEKAVTVATKETFKNVTDLENPFARYDPAAEVMFALDDVIKKKALPDAATVRKKVEEVVTNRFITSKSCNSEIVFKLDTEVEASLDFSSILSPVSAKLKLTAGVSGTTKYPIGEEFDIIRVRQLGSSNIFEIKTATDREGCGSAPTGQRIVVAGKDSTRGEINETTLEDAGFPKGNKGAPLYTCRAEFFALRDILSNKYFLPQPISTFVVANLSEFRGANDPSSCEKGSN